MRHTHQLKDGRHTWHYDSWKPLTIVPVAGYIAVYAHRTDDTKDGSWYRQGYPLGFVGIARKTRTHMSSDVLPGTKGCRSREDDSYSENEVVAYDLCPFDGWHILQDASNFLGIVKAGDPLSYADAYRDVDDYPDDKEICADGVNVGGGVAAG